MICIDWVALILFGLSLMAIPITAFFFYKAFTVHKRLGGGAKP